MFLLGHSCWSYLIAKLTGRKLHVNPSLSLALLAGILPDFDIYFQPFLEHHTYTHSILVLGPAAVILTLRYNRLGAAFSMGLLSHLLTDALVGTVPPFYPLTTTTIGLKLGLPSFTDTLLEVGALGGALLYMFKNGDSKQITQPDGKSLNLAIPLASIVTLSLLFAGDNNIHLATYAFSRRALTAISLGHITLVAVLGVGLMQGMRALHSRHSSSEQSKPLQSQNVPRTA